MQILVDADACPMAIKEILYRAAERRRVVVTLVANQVLRPPRSPYVKTVRVGAGFNVADGEILARLAAGDLVVTGDIPLAAEVIARGGHALNPRGERYDPENIAERLATRNFMAEMRSAGLEVGGPAALNQRDRQAFANQLDRLLTAALP